MFTMLKAATIFIVYGKRMRMNYCRYKPCFLVK